MFQWECTHEKDAKVSYHSMMIKHENFKISNAGLFIDDTHLFLVASQDSMMESSCCSKKMLETKCTYCHKDDLLESNDNFYMI